MFGVKRSREDDGPELAHHHKLPKKRDLSSQSSGCKPESTADLDLDLDLNQTLRFRAPTLTPVDSDDEDSSPKQHSRSNTSVGSSNKSAQSLCHSIGSTSHSVNPLFTTSGNVLRPNCSGTNVDSLPQSTSDQSFGTKGLSSIIPMHTQGPTTQSCMEDPAYGKDNDSLVSSARLPSPVSDDDHDTNMESVAPSDTDMAFYSHSPQCSPVPGCTESTSFLKPALCHSSTAQDSDATTRSSNPLTRKKPTLVMGYRADCDKCRRQIPGHYSHIIQ
ncbi:hypothetical protein N7456_011868 [Penicillium angulare]|uniref:Uncharacterized protein n=1 Tax=Penicillium angulare TaxID=116970 RepID=A0A9W9EUM6_9EURO|nr:hypothetical protein N7456_011868 [Penicillium angulare]